MKVVQYVCRCRLLATVLRLWLYCSKWPLQWHPEEGYTFAIVPGFFSSTYSKFVEEEDNKMVDHWQKEAKGIRPFAFGTTL